LREINAKKNELAAGNQTGSWHVTSSLKSYASKQFDRLPDLL
jgi:hypothetical protein